MAHILKFRNLRIPARPHGRLVGRSTDLVGWLPFRQVISEVLFRARFGSSVLFSISMNGSFLWAVAGSAIGYLQQRSRRDGILMKGIETALLLLWHKGQISGWDLDPILSFRMFHHNMWLPVNFSYITKNFDSQFNNGRS